MAMTSKMWPTCLAVFPGSDVRTQLGGVALQFDWAWGVFLEFSGAYLLTCALTLVRTCEQEIEERILRRG